MKRVFGFLAALVCLVLAAVPAWASIPEPTEYFYVNDYANVLTQGTMQHIIDVNDDLYERTGAQIVVVTVDFLNGVDIEKYTYELFNKWGIGSAKNNGLLLLLAIGEDNYYVQRGSDLDRKLSSGEVGDINDEYLEPYFADGDYDKGVQAVFDAFVSKIETIYASSSAGSNSGQAAAMTGSGSSSNSGYSSNYYQNTQPAFFVSLFNGFWSLIRFVVIVIVVIAFLNMMFGSRRRRHPGDGNISPGRGFFWGYGMGRATRRYHHPPPHHHHPPTSGGSPMGGGPRPGGSPMGGSPRPGGMSGQNRSGGGGFSIGGGTGRSGGSRPSGGFGGGSRPSGGFGGGSRSGGGGASRGGGTGRR